MSHHRLTQFRRYREGEAAKLLELFRDTVRRINHRDYSPEQIAAWASDSIDPATWENQFVTRTTIVAELSGAIVGFADLEHDGHLDRFYIHADHQRAGIGRGLLAAIESGASRLALPRLFTEASITAKPFFDRHGFVTLARQQVIRRGVTFVNYRMEKWLS